MFKHMLQSLSPDFKWFFSQDCVTFEIKTSEKSLDAEYVSYCCDKLSGLKKSSVGKSIEVILTAVSVQKGVLEIKVLDQSMDCCFTQQD